MESRQSTPQDTAHDCITPDDNGAPAVPVRKRGRPRKTPTVTRSKDSSPAIENSNDSSTPSKKKRGRKSLAELAKEAASKGHLSDSSVPLSPSSEKRGRLSTWAYAEYSDASDDDYQEKSVKRQQKTTGTPTSGKKRGRPPKNPTKTEESDTAVKTGPKRKRGRPPKNRPTEASTTEEEKEMQIRNGTSKMSSSPDNDSGSSTTQKISSYNDTGAVPSEKRRRGRPRKVEKSNPSGKWNDVNTPHIGRYSIPLPVPDSWPMLMNMDEILKEVSEMYANVKCEKRGEFHNQLKAFVFALHWEDGSFSTS